MGIIVAGVAVAGFVASVTSGNHETKSPPSNVGSKHRPATRAAICNETLSIQGARDPAGD